MKISGTLFIAGMHRSGTSLTAQWLHANGLFLGHNLLSGYSDNKYGHFEDLEFLEKMTSNLKSFHLHDTGLFLNEISTFEFTKKIKDDLATLINERNAKQEVWGWKEPRSTLYIMKFKELIPKLKVIAVYRNPALVIESLYKRFKKNKWYYTRNPLKRFVWFLDIDLQEAKWIKKFENAYCIYNKKILEFKEKYPNDIIIINSKNIIDNGFLVQQWLYNNLAFNMVKDADEIFDSQILSSNAIINPETIPNATRIFNQLNKVESRP